MGDGGLTRGRGYWRKVLKIPLLDPVTPSPRHMGQLPHRLIGGKCS